MLLFWTAAPANNFAGISYRHGFHSLAGTVAPTVVTLGAVRGWNPGLSFACMGSWTFTGVPMAYLDEHIAHYCEFRRQILADLNE